MRRSTKVASVVAAASTAGAVFGVGSPGNSSPGVPLVRYHEPSAGWTTRVPADWPSAGIGPQFIRGRSIRDPTVLVLFTYRRRSAAEALHAFAAFAGFDTPKAAGVSVGGALNWARFRSRTRSDPTLRLELGVAKNASNAYVAALVGRRYEIERLLQAVLLPALESFVPGPPDLPTSVLAQAAVAPSYWPTLGWRTATPASQGMDRRRLDALVAAIRAQKMPIDSITVVRHGYVVLDVAFPPFASGRLGQPYASGNLHELHSATKSVTSALVGIALHDAASGGARVTTPIVRVFTPYRPARTDARKRAMTLEDMLTMQAGLAWKEWGAAYAHGSGNDLVTMIETAPNWTKFVLDRPMGDAPGTSFLYNSGASHVLSAAVSSLTGRPAADIAEERLFTPLGIRDHVWRASPEGVTSGFAGLRLRPRDLAKLAFLYLHNGTWSGREIVPAAWVARSTTDHVSDPVYEYGYQWWLDRADGYAYMSGRFGQTAVVAPTADLVAVITAHLPEAMSGTTPRVLLERYILPAAR